MTHCDTEIVSRVRARLESEIGPERFDVWFGEGVRFEATADSVSVVADSTFRSERLKKSLLREIENAVNGALGDSVAVSFRVEEPVDSVADVATPDAALVKQRRVAAQVRHRSPAVESSEATAGESERSADAVSHVGTRLTVSRGRPFAKLAEFEAGACNQVALSAVELVIRHPGQMNPLLIHGPNGSGKTHLLEGIWSEVRRRGGRRTIYLAAEQFTTYFLQALRGSGLPSFRQKYRAVDLLILDDIQFFSGKQATITELLHTIDTLVRDGRQIVLAADRAPTELEGLGSDLQHRVSGGLTCPLMPLDQATRVAVLTRFAAQRNLTLDKELLERIACQTPGDARQLAGFLNRLWATSAAWSRNIDRDMVDELLSELYPAAHQVIKLDDIQRVICDEFGLDLTTLRSDQRTRRVSYPRMLAMWLARKHTGAALTEIGDYFGRKSHSTVVAAQTKVEQWVHTGEKVDQFHACSDVRTLVQRLERRLHA